MWNNSSIGPQSGHFNLKQTPPVNVNCNDQLQANATLCKFHEANQEETMQVAANCISPVKVSDELWNPNDSLAFVSFCLIMSHPMIIHSASRKLPFKCHWRSVCASRKASLTHKFVYSVRLCDQQHFVWKLARISCSHCCNGHALACKSTSKISKNDHHLFFN